jgi:hypothetical protein
MHINEAKREYNKKYYQKNKARFQAAAKVWTSKNRDRINAYNRRYWNQPENIERRRNYLRTWRAKNRDRNNEHGIKDRRDKRHRAFQLLGGKCVKCGFPDSRALQVDHIQAIGGTCASRAKSRELAIPLYRALLRGEKDISKYQLLCANCNIIKFWENKEWRKK